MSLIICNLGDLKATELLIKHCAGDVKKLQEPWPLHIAAEGGYFLNEY